MRNLKVNLALVALTLAVLLVAQQAQCQTSGTLSGTITGMIDDPLDPFPIDSAKGNLTIVVHDPYNATIGFSLNPTLDENGNFQIDCPAGQYRILFNASVSVKGVFYYGFYKGTTSARAGCFADSELVSVTAGQNTDISSLLVMDFMGKTVFPDLFAISGKITGSTNGDPINPQVSAMDACNGDVLGSALISKIIIKDDPEIVETLFSFNTRWSGPVRLRFLSDNYPPEFYGADGQDDFSKATIISPGTQDLGVVVIGPKNPKIFVDPTALGFGDVMLLDSRTQAITISNQGTKALEIGAVAFETPQSDFFLTNPPAIPFTLQVGTSETISITYSSRAMGDATANLSISSNDNDHPKVLVSLTGTGVASAALPSDQVSQVVNFINKSITTGGLTPKMPGGQDVMLKNQITSAGQMAAAGKKAAACSQLRNALERVDGNPIPPDFLEGPDSELLRELIQNTINSLGCK
jgi:hypothetical protein